MAASLFLCQLEVDSIVLFSCSSALLATARSVAGSYKYRSCFHWLPQPLFLCFPACGVVDRPHSYPTLLSLKFLYFCLLLSTTNCNQY
ncbi:hypothetical protein EDB86DRAFT_161122 [Lactarius hatsudake]|nr:hypothetical protein EDB86DRAFT_161122 [Lactarius hatsudake]